VATKAEIMAVVGDCLEPGRRYGNSPEQKLANTLGGSVESASHIVNYYRWLEARGCWQSPRPIRSSAVERRLVDHSDTITDVRHRIQTHSMICKAAKHESGHALVVLDCGGKVLRVEVSSDGSGICRYERGKLNINQEVCILLAGAVACDSSLSTAECSSDRADLIAELRAFRETERGNTWLPDVEISDGQLLTAAWSMFDEVQRTIDSQRPFLNACTTDLISHKRLDGAAVHSLWEKFKR